MLFLMMKPAGRFPNMRPANLLYLSSPLRQYSQAARKMPVPHKKPPRIRYLLGVVVLSFGLLHFVSQRVDKKQPKTSFNESEFDQYERETGLKRRHKLITSELGLKYSFYVVPFASSISDVAAAIEKNNSSGRPVKIINSEDLVKKEIEEEGRYSYLLNEIKRDGRSMPSGLFTALVKQEVNLFLNTTNGQYDTDIVLINYPQSTEEAIKFENDISDVTSCIILKDNEASLASALSEEELRKINNIYGYFSTVDKVKKL